MSERTGDPLSVAAAQAPNGAGVYFFLGADGELLYAGKAGSLKRRLQQHAHAKPAAGGVRMDVLYERSRDIRWAQVPDEHTAAVWEADVIVALRPRFNASHTGEGRWNYIVVRPRDEDGRTVRFALTTEPDAGPGRAYGCFPHLGRGVSSVPAISCSDGYAALLRLLWAASSEPGKHVPARVTRAAPDAFETVVVSSARPSLHAFLLGTSTRLLDELMVAGERHEAPLRSALRRDVDTARAFFVAAPQALRGLRLRHRAAAGPMSKTAIERLVVADLRAAIGDFRLPPAPDDADDALGRRAHRWAKF